jgi:hypothetical protein
MDRRLPILHVVYAGRGDSMYVEFSPENNQDSPLFVMDGGPRSHGAYGQGDGEKGKGKGKGNGNGKKTTGGTGGNRPYWRFFFSAGKEIWFDESQLGKPANETFKLHAMVNSHAHEDHCEGMYDMITNLTTDFLKLETGFITPAFDDAKKKPKGHIGDLWTALCSKGPGLCFPLRTDGKLATTWDRSDFFGGVIEYPPLARVPDPNRVGILVPRKDLDKPTVLCLRRPQPGWLPIPKQTPTQTGLVDLVDLIQPYVESLQTDTINTGKALNDVNLSSLLIHVPQQQGNPSGGIYLTGDNNGNLINIFMEKHAPDLPRDPGQDVNQPAKKGKRHFGTWSGFTPSSPKAAN